MPSLICVPLLVEAPDSALRDAAAARQAGADLVEYRIDGFFSGSGEAYEEEQILHLVAESPVPCIITCRPAREGGYYDGDDMARVALFERLGTAFGKDERPPRYLDVELETYTRSANLRQKVNLAIEHPEQLRDLRTSLILSIHDFSGRPRDLSRLLLKLRAEPAAQVHKIAWRARSARDNIELFDLLAHRDRPTIAVGMGEFGLMSRVLAPKFGGFATFAGLHQRDVTAPGQPTIDELLNLYRFRSITPRTSTYGIIGSPLKHSLSPHLHNAGFDAVEHDGVYVPMPVAEGYESLKATLLELIDYAPLHFRGASITHPHKENLVRLARDVGWELDDCSARSGAANTLAIERDETSGSVTRIRISNTDAPALAHTVAKHLGDVQGRKFAILGAGGAARAAACALSRLGGHLTVYNRNHARAVELAGSLGDTAPGTVAAGELASIEPWDVCINCTPLGMRGGPAPDDLPLPPEALSNASPGAVVIDTVYNPAETPLLRAARDAGLQAVGGGGMFIAQASAQFEQWTGRAAPHQLFERIVHDHLHDA